MGWNTLRFVVRASLDRTSTPVERLIVPDLTQGVEPTTVHEIWHIMVDYGFLVLACVCVVGLAIAFTTAIFIYRSHVDRHSLFFVLYEDKIRRVFRQQPRDLHATIVSGVNHILRPYPERPTVLLLMASKGSGATALLLARTLANVVLSVFQPSNVPDTKMITLAGGNFAFPDDYWHFYECLSHLMVEFRVAIITDFEHMSAQVATVLCHLADDTYAPYPQALLLVLVNISDDFCKGQLQKYAPVSVAEMYFGELWEFSLDRPLMLDLMSRVTGRSVLVAEEKPPS